jgi:1-phosphatidylinositol-4-phosphate 5-kinase
VSINEKYDLKGSLYKRKASRQERTKSSPTYKDLDFLEKYPDGLFLEERHYADIIGCMHRDCLVLESFDIMDYSLLLGIHKMDGGHGGDQQLSVTKKTRSELYEAASSKLGDLSCNLNDANVYASTSSFSSGNL